MCVEARVGAPGRVHGGTFKCRKARESSFQGLQKVLESVETEDIGFLIEMP